MCLGLGFWENIFLRTKVSQLQSQPPHAQKPETDYLWAVWTGARLGGLGSVCDFPVHRREHKALEFLCFVNNPHPIQWQAFKSFPRESHTSPQWFYQEIGGQMSYSKTWETSWREVQTLCPEFGSLSQPTAQGTSVPLPSPSARFPLLTIDKK